MGDPNAAAAPAQPVATPSANPIAQLKQEAADVVKEEKEREEQFGKYPLMWLPNGITKMRLLLDPTGKLIRAVHRYKINDVPLPFMGEGSEVEKLVDQLDDLGVQNTWRYRARVWYMSYAYVVQAEEASDMVKLNTHVLLVYNHKVRTEIMKRLNEWPEEFITRMLSVGVPEFAWTFDYKHGSQGNISIGSDPVLQITVPPLEADAKPLVDCWITTSTKPSEQDLNKALTFLRNKIQEAKNAPQQPDPAAAAPTTNLPPDGPAAPAQPAAPATQPATPPTPPPAAAPATPPPPTPDAPPPAATPPADPAAAAAPPTPEPPALAPGTCPKAGEQVNGKALAYGAHQNCPQCLLCGNEPACKAATPQG